MDSVFFKTTFIKRWFFFVTVFFVTCSYLCAGQIIEISPTTTDKIKYAQSEDTLFLLPGTYKLNIELKDGVSITAEEEGKVIIEPLDFEKPVLLKYGSGTIEKLIIRGANGDWYANAVYLSNSDAVVRKNIISSNKPYGIYASFFNGQIIDNIIENNEIDGIKIYNSEALIKNNSIFSNKDDGIQMLHCNTSVDSNCFFNNSGNAVELWFDYRSVIKNNLFIKNNFDISISAGNNNSVILNNFNDTFSKSVEQENSENVKNETVKEKMIPLTKIEEKKNSINTVSGNFFSNPDNINGVLDYMMLKENDFNLSYRQNPDTIELPVFTKLFQNTIETPECFNIISDSLINSGSISEKLYNVFLLDKIPVEEKYGEFTEAAAEIDLPDYFPETLKNDLNEIYRYSVKYAECFEKFKKSLADTEFSFLKENILNNFSNTGKSLKMNMREELKSSDDNDKDNMKLKKILDKIDLTDLKKISYKIVIISEKIRKYDFSGIDKKLIEKDILFEKNTRLGKIIIAGTSDNYHANSDCFILLDLGGDDFYKNKIASSDEKKLISVYIDFSGNDNYISDTYFDLGSTVFGISCLFDNSGEDRYFGKNNSVASSYFGISVISDISGNDNYQSELYGIGAALFGVSILDDMNGNDVYNGGAYCEGFGSVKGYGILIDYKGSDFYLSGNRIIDSIRYYTNSITMSQGCGYGIRPYVPGGLGMLIDYEGNDLYKSDVYGQAASYWMGIGCLIDYSGDDKYVAHRYSQGSGIHLGISCLMDFSGNDEYNNWEVGQGCGHDVSFGLLYDKSGDDIYNQRHLGNGGAITTAIGIFVDESGDDGYYSISKNLGFGEYFVLREFGSIAVFFDKSGNDRYLNSKNSDLKVLGKYGIYYDK
ncbi:right-handed parallel beta-helix repeat-containing protein [Candidatus Dependentiae bacterium]|nr:right-handed parallel beta-helix repeat-containing protein [Candidatus Dependentiae bacterium]